METIGWIVLILITSDFITGIFHWIEDEYCWESMGGIIGKQICGPNLMHHIDQLSMLQGDFFHRNYVVMTITLPIMVLSLLFGWYFLAAVAAVTSLSNEVHAWEHRKPTNVIPRILQEMCIVQTPQHHARHHRKPYNKCYCTYTNLLNPILDRIKFWRGLEYIIKRITGVESNSFKLLKTM